MNHRTLPLLVVLIGSLGLFAGCRSVPLDKGGSMKATYVAGRFNMIVNGNAAQAARAVNQAFNQLGMFVVKSEQKTFSSAELAARTAKDEKVRVSINEINSRQTEIGIRVDLAGDQNLSRKLYERIEANLGKL
jgi:hypothetical protein